MAKLTAFFLALQMFLCSFFGIGRLNAADSYKVAQNGYAAAGYALSTQIQKNCYSLYKHTLDRATDADGMPFVWPAACYLEMLSDTYRLFSGDLTLRINYRDMLKNTIAKYLAEDQAIETAAGPVTGVSYYNSYAGGTGSYYYDDNEWVCIQLLTGYRNLGDKELLAAAEENLAFLWTGWDDAAGGGIYWYMDRQSKNACSNAPAAIAFLLAYQITGKEVYLERGKMIFDWMNNTMRIGDLFDDNVGPDGTIRNYWKGIYNQATMIYAGSLLYEITEDESYYALTKATVDATLPHMFTQTVDEEGGVVITMNANPIFKAWCVGWLGRAYVKFYEVDPGKDTAPMDHYCAVMTAELQTKDKNGLYDPFFCSGDADPENYTELLAQCGVACALLNAAVFDATLKDTDR